MKTITEQLAQYACYHRDRRNIATHLVGIPLIVIAIVTLLSRPTLFALGPVSVTPALFVTLAAVLYYIRLDGRLGALMAILLTVCLWGGLNIAQSTTAVWLSWGIGMFVVGWVWQFVGHYFEGRKPAFVDDIVGLVIGPLFVVAEVVFLLGLRRSLRHSVEAKVAEVMPAATHSSSTAAKS